VAGYLIDSHIFFWAIDAPEKLHAAERALLGDANEDISVSVVTLWELSIKVAKGALPLSRGKPSVGDDYFARQARIAGFGILSIDPPEAEYVRRLPPIHRDPFDRLLVAQAILSGRTVVTRDDVFSRYPGVRVFAS
jgi:PIN domain nuclease of toxin-antitoxin system